MDYEAAAEELLEIQSEISKMQVERLMDDYIRGEMYALTILYRHEGSAYPKEISTGMRVSSARVAVLINHMEKKGWVKRSPDKKDSRQTIVSMTDLGQEVLQREKQERIQQIVELLEKLGEDDVREWLRIRRKMLEL